jgi:DNA-binding MarR family transcriptional regulator
MTNALDRSLMIAETIDDLRRVFQSMSDFSRLAERETGLTGPQLWAVKVINECNSIRVSDLAKRMYLHPTTVVGILDRLELQGLIQRTRSKTDRRVVQVELTITGYKLVANSPDVAQGLLINGLERIDYDKLQRVHEGMAEFVKILGVEGVPPRLILTNEENLGSKEK